MLHAGVVENNIIISVTDGVWTDFCIIVGLGSVLILKVFANAA